jgi:uncharacterized protein (TIGR03905 family)
MKTLEYTPVGTCSKKINLAVEDGKIAHVQFLNGCEGNLIAVSRLVTGMPVEQAIGLLKGIDCHGKGTSCADQLALALEQITQDN